MGFLVLLSDDIIKHHADGRSVDFFISCREFCFFSFEYDYKGYSFIYVPLSLIVLCFPRSLYYGKIFSLPVGMHGHEPSGHILSVGFRLKRISGVHR